MKETCLKAYENQEYPFEELVEAVKVRRDISRNPLFDVMLTLQNNEDVPLKLNGLELTGGVPASQIAKFDLGFTVYKVQAEYIVSTGYCVDLFKTETIQWLNRHYKEAICMMFAAPNKRIEDLSLIDEVECKKLVYHFNDTATEYPQDQTVIDLFEKQVRKTPDNIAVVFEDTQLTYRELNEKANQLARKLRKLGVKPDDFVAMLTERSLEMIVGIYGILKAGGAYVPMDPTYPEERIRYMLGDCKPKAVLTYRAEIKTDIPRIDLADSQVWTGAPRNLPHVNKPEDLAYCIYTSGTTGKPKGVLVKQQNVVNYVQRSDRSVAKYAFEKNLSHVVSVTNLTFDIFVTEAILPLCNGMSVSIANHDEQTEMQAFERMVKRNKIEVLQTTPSRIKALLSQDGHTDAFSSLRFIMLGGEVVGSDTVNRLREKTEAVLENVYGPSESTVWSTCYAIDHRERIIPIGKPIQNTRIYILNGVNLCGIGMPGELCIAGGGVARGYLNRPELTAEKFVQNPFGEGTLYLTGDLARWLPDGNLEYLGRIDEQVKIRGFRIELGEIENSIRAIEGIKDCAVIVRTDAEGEKAICAYLVSDEEIRTSEIRDTLAQALPEYMIPAYMTQIGKLPVNRNGKLDKQALPEIAGKSERVYVAPGNPEEEAVCTAFSEVLGVEKVGVKDSFFELGGDSIKAIRVISKLRERGYQPAMQIILHNLTVEKIALQLRQNESRYEQGAVSGEVPMTPTQSAFFAESKPEKCSQEIQSLLFSAEERMPEAALHAILQKLVEHHDILRAVFRDGKQIILPVRESKLYMLVSKELKSANELEAEAQRLQGGFHLEEGPLFRAGLFYVGERSYLLLMIHPLVVDEDSWRILMEDFKTAYSQWKAGSEIQLPPKTASFKEWSELETAYAQRKELRQELAYWQRTEAEGKGLEGVVETDPGEVITKTFTLDANLTETLRRKGMRAYHAGWNDILLTGLLEAISAWNGQNQITVFLEDHGRAQLHEPISIDRTVGCFTSVYPVNLKKGSDMAATLTETMGQLRGVPNHGIGYGLLRTSDEANLRGLAGEIRYRFHRNSGADGDRRDVIQGSGENAKLSGISKLAQREAISVDCRILDKKLEICLGFNQNKVGKEAADTLAGRIQTELTMLAEGLAEAGDMRQETERQMAENMLNRYDHAVLMHASKTAETEETIIQEFFMRRERDCVMADRFDVYHHSLAEVQGAFARLAADYPVLRMAYDTHTKKYYEYDVQEADIQAAPMKAAQVEALDWHLTEIAQGFVGRERLLVKCFLTEKENGGITVSLYAHHAVWDMESSTIFRALLIEYLTKGRQNRVLPTEDRHNARQPSVELREYLNRYLEVVNCYHQKKNVEKCMMVYSVRNYLISAQSNPVEMALKILHHIAKNHSEKPQDLPILLLYHARNNRNHKSVGLYLDVLPVVCHLGQDAHTAVEMLEREKNQLIQQDFSSQWLPEIFSASVFRAVESKTPVVNIRFFNETAEFGALLESEGGNREIPADISLLELGVDVYTNGFVLSCVVEKQKEQAIRQMLDQLLAEGKL